jgi:hypothetical protein
MDGNRRGKVERGARGEKGQGEYATSRVEQVRGAATFGNVLLVFTLLGVFHMRSPCAAPPVRPTRHYSAYRRVGRT